ncbi:response regulator transcription factor [Bacillus sp. MUM 13]|uniref:response regulator n=1 Tax=Bacillus sp. MUM 13 TaxID=1678001 RepID=UPI0008F5E334|nr:response regulator transcription factor [Bacillus sp. MUM 13]OIK09173.1 DNA-binding response regulator [Bacillus sp. MUM 13]
MTKIRLAVIDDHELVRKGIISFLETEPDIEIVGEGSSGRDAINLAAKHKPDVILMDLLMENGTGIEATKEIMETGSACRIVILTSYFDEKEVFPALEAGAFSYLLKTSPAFDVASAIRKAAKGEAVIEPRVTDVMVKRLRNKEAKLHDGLTERERDVLLCIGEGMTNQEISEELFIGIKTVKTHVSSILGKLQVGDRTQAAVYANRNGLIKQQER